MVIVFMVIAAIIVVIIAFVGIVGGFNQRIKQSKTTQHEKIKELEARIDELEEKQKNRE